MSVASHRMMAHDIWSDRIEGRCFRRKKGTALFEAEKMTIDDSYAKHYNFITIIYRFRNIKKGYTVVVSEDEFRYGWEEA